MSSIFKESFPHKPSSMLVKAGSSIISSGSIQGQDLLNVSPKTLSSIYRAKVIDAYRDRRIFIVFGNYSTIRHSLLKRGWLEKLPPGRYNNLQGLPEEVLLQHAKRGNNYEAVAISKIINNFPAFFVWQPKSQRDLYMDVHPFRNRVRRSHSVDFSTKVGLIGCAEQQQWFRQDDVAEMLYPRFFRLSSNQEEQQAFIDEFRMTQCRSLLRYLVEHFTMPEKVLDYENGTIYPTIVQFALGRVKHQIDDWENNGCLDIENSDVPEDEWVDFLDKSNKVINQHTKIKCTYQELGDFTKTAESLLKRSEEKYQEFKWDGFKNLWILKPGYQSRGLGIILCNDIKEVLHCASMHSDRRYIAQKYIERPLLIYRTKFDIRQYMLLFIREHTVQLWLYTDCYLRFSSHEYTIDDLREVIHLTNNAVQKKYKNKTNRDSRLPKNNMWSLEQFKAYLKEQNVPEDTWDKRILFGFQKNLIAVVLASLDETDLNENCFELYGCDFMLDEQYNPILIEINSTPDLSASTDVTARICPMVMQDCIKVVVDLPRNSKVSTGLFRLVYEVDYKFKQVCNAKEGLIVDGKSMKCYKRSFLKEKSKFIKKAKNDNPSNNNKKSTKRLQPQEITTPTLAKSSKVKINESNNLPTSLKAVAKEALALHYTILK